MFTTVCGIPRDQEVETESSHPPPSLLREFHGVVVEVQGRVSETREGQDKRTAAVSLFGEKD